MRYLIKSKNNQRNQSMKSVDVLNICTEDWANFMCDHHKALKSVGVDSMMLKLVEHPWYLRDQAPVSREREIIQYAKSAKVIQIFHSDERLLNLLLFNAIKKPIIVYHTGTHYRLNFNKLNRQFNIGPVKKNVMCLPDLCGLGLQNEVYMVGAINTDKIQPSFKPIVKPFDFAHFPSNAEVKGTHRILKALHRVKSEAMFSYSVDTSHVSIEESIDRMRECDVYIELFKPKLGGRPYGAFGITCLEAAALGKIVITQNLKNHVYTKAYGDSPLQLFNTSIELRSIIKKLANASQYEIEALQNATRQWIVDKHSYQATGKYIKNNILNGLLVE